MSPEVQQRKYAFKCHRKQVEGVEVIYPVNALAFHPKYGTFATGGCDGTVAVWDGMNKKRLWRIQDAETSIASLCFSAEGDKLAVAESYTFEEGPREDASSKTIRTTIREVTASEVMPKNASVAAGGGGGNIPNNANKPHAPIGGSLGGGSLGSGFGGLPGLHGMPGGLPGGAMGGGPVGGPIAH
eukprot:Filipodium_phascolosomae@DN6882_c0_g1_i1.p1